MLKTALLAVASILLVGSIIVQPDLSFQAALQGIAVWWNIVFPGLLPFLVLYEIMLAFGLAHAAGVWLQPAMTRLFKLPGEAALALVLGWLGGYTAGSEAASSLRRRNIVTRSQGQRLLAYAHMPNPLFMLVVVGAGFLHRPAAGILIAAAVWLSALWLLIVTGILSRRNDAPDDAPTLAPPAAPRADVRRSLLSQAAAAMEDGRKQDGRSFGQALGDSVSAGVQKLMFVGGLMILASVLSRLTEPLLTLLTGRISPLLGPAIFESHLGAYAAAAWHPSHWSFAASCGAMAAVLAWSGLSGLLQAGYSTAGTDLRLAPLIAHRLSHAVHAFAATLLLWAPLNGLFRLWERIASTPAIQRAHSDASPIGQPGTITATELSSLWPHAAMLTCLLAALLLALRYVLFRYSGRH